MRPALLAVLIIVAGASQAPAQSLGLPSLTFPDPGTFCAPMQSCPPDVTRGTTR